MSFRATPTAKGGIERLTGKALDSRPTWFVPALLQRRTVRAAAGSFPTRRARRLAPEGLPNHSSCGAKNTNRANQGQGRFFAGVYGDFCGRFAALSRASTLTPRYSGGSRSSTSRQNVESSISTSGRRGDWYRSLAGDWTTNRPFSLIRNSMKRESGSTIQYSPMP
jgi:hypothetical protein